MKSLERWTLIFAALWLGACVSYMYHGEIQAPDSSGMVRETVLYWPRTNPLIGKQKAGPAVLRSACGTPVTFVEQPSGIVFRGTPGEDELVVQGGDGGDLICGRIRGYARFVDIKSEQVLVSIRCKPITDEFSVGRAYLQAKESAYIFPITVEKRHSLTGGLPPTPPPPHCDANSGR